MRIWCISDSHEYHNELNIPENVDMVIFAGDESNSSNPIGNLPACLNFLEWFKNLPIKHKVMISGN